MHPSCLALLALALVAGVRRCGVAAAGGRSLLQAAAQAAEREATAFEVTYGGYQNYFRSDGVASGEAASGEAAAGGAPPPPLHKRADRRCSFPLAQSALDWVDIKACMLFCPGEQTLSSRSLTRIAPPPPHAQASSC